ncbi:uncharacterized protein LOC111914050 [Lactuca sativa]|uniref:uncharacterized protein LOC111914050 n=1 Tax=Lactuca sativa TaxID=4236 RepID=UPI0022B05FA2|nr:uncharacterized protein LOC111914050 [Lactuca sativa]
MFKANPEIKQEEEKREEISFIQLDDEVLQKELDILLKEDPRKFTLHSEEVSEADKDLEELENFSHTLDSVTVSGSLDEQLAEEEKGMEVQHANVACIDTMPFGKGLSTGKNAGIKDREEEADHQFTTKPKARTIMKYEVIKFKEKDVQELVKKKRVKQNKRKKKAQAAEDEAMKRRRDELKRAYKKKINHVQKRTIFNW